MGAVAVLRRVEPTVVLQQLGSSLFDTALELLVQDRTANASYPGLSPEDGRQKAMTDFFLSYNLIGTLVSVVPALLLSRLSDRGWRKVPIAAALSGYVLNRLLLLLLLQARLPLAVMFGAQAVLGLTGGFSAYWAGVMTVTSLRSTEEERSKAMMVVELLYGTAGLLGSVVSGHLFLLYTPRLGHGSILLITSLLVHLLCLLHSIFLLQVKQVTISKSEETRLLPPESEETRLLPPESEETRLLPPESEETRLLPPESEETRLLPLESEETRLLPPPPSHPPSDVPVQLVNVLLLLAAGFLYDFAVGGASEILGVFVLKEPMSWSATQVGYGNASGFLVFLTSFLGVLVFRRCLSDASIVLVGMLSFAAGVYVTTYVTNTWMFYLARSVALFGLIPVPTIRSMLSQQVPASLCSTMLTFLQMTFLVARLIYIPIFTKVYQRTLDWCPGLVFTLSSAVTVLGMLPISVLGWRVPPKQRHQRLPGH